MEKSIFEQIGGTYSEVNSYLIPDLKLPDDNDNRDIGVFGRRHLNYIKKHKRLLYTELLTSGKLHSYLADLNEEALEMQERLVKQMAAQQGITEQLKADNQMEWIGRMNNIRASALEIVNIEIIFA
ncbi:MAG: TnpV protein [Clostridiales bacterium]|nr:TnpV protein [Clostridiales bacterium]